MRYKVEIDIITDSQIEIEAKDIREAREKANKLTLSDFVPKEIQEIWRKNVSNYMEIYQICGITPDETT